LGFVSAQAQSQELNQEITYNSHVGRIINENRVVGYHEGGIGSMQFSSFEQVRAWIAVTHLDEEGFYKLVADRKEKEERYLAANN